MADVDWEPLVLAARDAQLRAHSPYSRFAVGACLLSQQGRLHSGCNVENASYGLTVCAERHAVAAAVLAGDVKWTALVVVTSAAEPTPPCGACRQVLAEFASAQLPVRCLPAHGEPLDTTLGALLPHAFSVSSLA